MSLSVGIIGARGYVGRELLALIARHPELDLVFASSREWAGRPVTEMMEGTDADFGDLHFKALGPEEAAKGGADVVFLGLPTKMSGPFVEAIEAEAPGTLIIDLSSDYRHMGGWTYGLPERNRDKIADSRRIANPGCYATAAQLAIMPLKDLWSGPVHVFGLSGWSGAGTTPSRKNDPEVLKDNAIPYGLVGHNHEREIAEHSGTDARFSPMVAPFFRGLVTVVSGTLRERMTPEDVAARYEAAFAKEPFATLIGEAAEPGAAAGRHDCLIGPAELSEDGTRVVVTSALDNLLKGAASQAVQNLNIIMGWPEQTGLLAS